MQALHFTISILSNLHRFSHEAGEGVLVRDIEKDVGQPINSCSGWRNKRQPENKTNGQAFKNP